MTSRHTTIRLSAALRRRAKDYARQHDLTFTAVMERALASYLAEPHAGGAARARLALPAFGRGGVRPRVNLDDTSALLDLMDGIG